MLKTDKNLKVQEGSPECNWRNLIGLSVAKKSKMWILSVYLSEKHLLKPVTVFSNIFTCKYPLMMIILSPAKSMDMSITSPLPQGTVPRFQKEAEYIASQIQDYSRDQLQTLLQISNKLTDINYERYQEFDRENTPAKPAILAYTSGNLHPGRFSICSETPSDHFHLIRSAASPRSYQSLSHRF